VLSYLASTCLVARSSTNKPNKSNSMGAGVVGDEIDGISLVLLVFVVLCMVVRRTAF
jgi:hypothetical protein